MKNITIKGARLHNLKNIDVTIPKNKLIAATGVSGSGKSSLVFDLIFEEGRAQYLKGLGVLAGITEDDKFDNISGIGPALAVQQNIIRQSNPRATVGTKTGILNLLALLYAREGRTSRGAGENGPVVERAVDADALSPGYFSYNNPNGMCMKCSGRGSYYEINLSNLVPDEQTTPEQISAALGISSGLLNVLKRNFKEHFTTPFSRLPEDVKTDFIYGHFVNGNFQKRSFCITRFFEGRLFRGEDLSGLYDLVLCPECQGFRIGEEARGVFLAGRHLGELGLMTLSCLSTFLAGLKETEDLTVFGENLLKEIRHKTEGLLKARLGHLTLYREMPSLSGGEIQRLFLNSHLNSGMDSLIYILDEPTSGLHESEKADLLESIQSLKDLGNTVIIVEHDKKVIQKTEHIIDLGPGAGTEGGEIVYQGDFPGLLECGHSVTGRYLSGKEEMPVRVKKELSEASPSIKIIGAGTNNLKDVNVSIPLGSLVGVAGVSGSGKSSLISDTLIPFLKNRFRDKNGPSGFSGGEPEEDPEYPKRSGAGRQNTNPDTAGLDQSEAEQQDQPGIILTRVRRIEGFEILEGCAEISQAPIGRNINSNPLTYTGTWDKIRALFAGLPEAKEAGLSAGHFSFNSKGACPVCGGSGQEKTWMGGSFFIYRTCGECGGKRYSAEALSVKYKGKSISDVLEMNISRALEFFAGEPGISQPLKVLERIVMGYIKLGQPTPTLSGGEAQRVKLAKEIGRQRRGNILYVLDEPTTGLSLYDTAKLLLLLDELVKKGNSVIVIEHDTEVLSACDWIIELGPEGGTEGGSIIAQGAPEDLKQDPRSKTGKYLK